MHIKIIIYFSSIETVSKPVFHQNQTEELHCLRKRHKCFTISKNRFSVFCRQNVVSQSKLSLARYSKSNIKRKLTRNVFHLLELLNKNIRSYFNNDDKVLSSKNPQLTPNFKKKKLEIFIYSESIQK